MKFSVVVSGTVLYETDDELIAGAMAHSYRSGGWKDVEVVEND